MTYYLIGKKGTTHTNPEATFNDEEETKSNSDSNVGFNEDLKITLETIEDISNNTGHNTNTTDSGPVQYNPGGNTDVTEVHEAQQLGCNSHLSEDSTHQVSSGDTSPLILSSIAVISGSSETHLLEKSDADD
jgi:hypothetical protein